MRVLVADGHQIVRRGVRALLESHDGYDICGEAADGRQTLEIAHREKPDVVILDYAMPDISGIEIARRIRRQVPAPEVVIFTEDDEDYLIRDAFQAGARAFVLKNETDEHLLNALTAVHQNKPYLTARVMEVMVTSFAGTARDHSPLTRREAEIVRLIAEAFSSKEIAVQLALSVKTVDTHRMSAMRKLGTRNVAELVRYAIRYKLVAN